MNLQLHINNMCKPIILRLICFALSLGIMTCVASCSNEMPFDNINEGEISITFQAPHGVRSRGTNFYGDGDGNFTVRYVIESLDGKMIYCSDEANAPRPVEHSKGEWSLKVRLIMGEKYRILAWADQFSGMAESPYDVNLSTGDLIVNFDRGAGEDLDDAFTAYFEFSAGDDVRINMRRPFCQIIIGSNEKFVKENEVSSCIGLDGADGKDAQIYSRLNLKTGVVDDPLAFDISGNWRSSQLYTSRDFYGDTDAKYIAMRYLIPTKNDSKLTFDLRAGDELRSYTVDIGDYISANSRIVIVPESGFFDKDENVVHFSIIHDATFSGDDKKFHISPN